MIQTLDHRSPSHSFQYGGEQDQEKEKKKSKLLTREGKLAPGARRARGFQLFDNETESSPTVSERPNPDPAVEETRSLCYLGCR